jgi:hypothetical protein
MSRKRNRPIVFCADRKWMRTGTPLVVEGELSIGCQDFYSLPGVLFAEGCQRFTGQA